MKTIAFYLPQFHPIPENDDWWGPGFTEWHSVVKARPRFRGHHQPQIPANLGFYDLRTPETRQAQADMAMSYGVDAFCYYHYWFSGKLVLETPAEAVLKDGAPDFPFLFNWANENWSRIWDGSSTDLLLSQNYGREDHVAHFKYLEKFFCDPRYLRRDGKPVFLIQRPEQIPDLSAFIEIWRELAKENDDIQDIYFVAVNGSGVPDEIERDWVKSGFDAVSDFQPRSKALPPRRGKNRLYEQAKNILPHKAYGFLKKSVKATKRFSYTEAVESYDRLEWPTDYIKFPCVYPSWDNTARRKTAFIVQNTSPGEFKKFLRVAEKKRDANPEQIDYLFVNAWNEWAEGCHLEPDQLIGMGFLEALAEWKSER